MIAQVDYELMTGIIKKKDEKMKNIEKQQNYIFT